MLSCNYLSCYSLRVSHYLFLFVLKLKLHLATFCTKDDPIARYSLLHNNALLFCEHSPYA